MILFIANIIKVANITMNEELINLSHFKDGITNKYHVYKLNDSTLAQHDHYHDYFQVLFVCSGEVTHTHLGESIRLYRGDAFIIPPYFVHRLSFLSTETDVYSLSFSTELFHDGFSRSEIYGFLTELKKQTSIHLRISLDNDELISVNSLMEILSKEKSGEYSAATSLISSIICILARGYHRHINLNSDHTYSIGINRCGEYIDSHFQEEISIHSLSKSFGMSSSDLCRKFPQYTGLTVGKYINLKRINFAETLLKDGQYRSIQEVAEKCGYNDFSTFYRNFIRITGVKPSVYAKGQLL